MIDLNTLNPMQREAVASTEGPLLILAGAGSGKTRVLVHRIAYLIGEMNVAPWNILAITFTNKAAAEMRERVDRIVGQGAESVWVSTFHSMCVRILRRYIDNLGYGNSFSIYDTDDQKALMRQILKRLNIDPKKFREKSVLGEISAAKNAMIGEEQYMDDNGGSFPGKIFANCYMEYQKELKKNNALDFDDLLVKTVQLFEKYPQVLDYYQDRFRYIMVDEYQDTNTVQFRLIDLLAKRHRNLCVVGDDDQSIYGFRGADIHNILSFEKAFEGAKVIKLEQNYRSTKSILDAANEVIANNRGRKDKKLWTDNDQGDKVTFELYSNAYEEAEGIAKDVISRKAACQADYSDFAVLYRTNAQSRIVEEKFLQYNIPYRLVGGVNFYQRKEIKDVLAYLKTIANGLDDIAVQRIINVPKRGIGAASVGKIIDFSAANGMSFYRGLKSASNIMSAGKALNGMKKFVEQIEDFRIRANEISIRDLIEAVLDETGLRDEIRAEGEVEAEARLENIDELENKAVSYANGTDHPTLDGFLEEVALVADIDSMDDSENRAVLMTLHSAKGLEFPYVYMSGMEDGLFPSGMAISDGDPSAIEEERRLCYVGITRAEKKLTLTAAMQRMIHGQTMGETVSRFVEEIPENMIEVKDLSGGMSYGSRFGGGYGSERRRYDWEDSDGLPWETPSARGRSTGSGNGFGSSSGFGGGFGFGGGTGFGGAGSGSSSGFGKGAAFGGGAGYGSADRGSSYRGSAGLKSVSATGAAKKGLGGIQKGSAMTKPDHLNYEEGDRVSHIKFGAGTVKAIKDEGRDYEVTVEFDRVGQKKMLAGFAKLKKVDQ
ncbi:ATP-dependent helicase [[Clostridium] aminophilum]|uniref:ATP-dependent DNA helicase PcrA n=1 Tax=[Clostridium] aminophilum TaxID=1526 RepID=A0A1I6JQR7_9FIRM|nr:UvrD-helicase domain-containing protein [[Clostridium] aminophilum]SFR81326.1 DNA helicase-2 / ATP-dependent DNA helicase PcrA [[Clostridium] aminophilum]